MKLGILIFLNPLLTTSLPRLKAHDPWLVAHDFASFVQAQEHVEQAYLDTSHWTKMSILNTAASGMFSSDRTISQYSDDIWHLEPLLDTRTQQHTEKSS